MDQRCIRIESRAGEQGGSFLSVIDAETGKPCSDLSSILIRITPNDVVVADITCSDMSVRRSHVTEISVTISDDAMPVLER